VGALGTHATTWFADAPVLLGFDVRQAVINHQNLDALNALDENGLAFGSPDPRYARHPLHSVRWTDRAMRPCVQR
jgi:hypothetical protein